MFLSLLVDIFEAPMHPLVGCKGIHFRGALSARADMEVAFVALDEGSEHARLLNMGSGLGGHSRTLVVALLHA